MPDAEQWGCEAARRGVWKAGDGTYEGQKETRYCTIRSILSAPEEGPGTAKGPSRRSIRPERVGLF